MYSREYGIVAGGIARVESYQNIGAGLGVNVCGDVTGFEGQGVEVGVALGGEGGGYRVHVRAEGRTGLNAGRTDVNVRGGEVVVEGEGQVTAAAAGVDNFEGVRGGGREALVFYELPDDLYEFLALL